MIAPTTIEPVAPYRRSVLPNGLRVLTATMPATRSVSVAFYIGAGSRYEEDAEAGISHYLEHMFFKGTERRQTAQEVSETIERVGGYMNGSTDREVTVYWVRVARPHFALALDLMADMLQYSKFDHEEIEKERQVILEELHTVNDVPGQRAFLLADAALWPDQPLGRDVAGTPDSVNAIQRDMLLAYQRQQYDPANTVLSVAGQVSHEEVLEMADRLLGNQRPGTPRPWIPARDVAPANRCLLEYRRTEQAHICLAIPGIASHDPARYSLDLLNAILGEGMASRLFLELREKHSLVYEVSSSVIHLRDCGGITVYAGADPKRAPAALDAILRELGRATQGIQPSEIERARELLKGRLLLRLEDTRGVSGWLGAQELLLDRVHTPEETVEALDRVTEDDIQEVGRRLLRPELYRAAIVGPFRSDRRFATLMNGGS